MFHHQCLSLVFFLSCSLWLTMSTIVDPCQILLQRNFILTRHYTALSWQETIPLRTSRFCRTYLHWRNADDCRTHRSSFFFLWRLGEPHILPRLHSRQCTQISQRGCHGAPRWRVRFPPKQWSELPQLHDFWSIKRSRTKITGRKVNILLESGGVKRYK